MSSQKSYVKEIRAAKGWRKLFKRWVHAFRLWKHFNSQSTEYFSFSKALDSADFIEVVDTIE